MLSQLSLLAQMGETHTLGQSLSAWSKLGIAVAIVLATYLVARVASSKLRMPDIRWRIGLASFALLSGLVITILGWPPRQGIDLSGGVIMIFEIKPEPQVGDAADVQDAAGGAAARGQVVVKQPGEMSEEELTAFRSFVSLPDFDVSRVDILDSAEAQRVGDFERFTFDTSNRSIAAVESVLEGVFKGRLASNQVVVKKVELDAEMSADGESPPAANGPAGGGGAPMTTADVRREVNDWNERVEKAGPAELSGLLPDELGDGIAARLIQEFAEWQAVGQDQEEGGVIDSSTMDKLITQIKKRIDPSGTKEIVVRKYGSRQIEIKIPKVNESEKEAIKSVITSLGELEFRILAQDKVSEHKDIMRAALALSDDEKVLSMGGQNVARWVPIEENKEDLLNRFGAKDWKPTDPDEIANSQGFATRIIERPDGTQRHEILVLLDSWNVDGRYLARVGPGTADGQHSVDFSFNTEGSRLFGGLTKEHQPRADGHKYHLAILLNGRLESAPTINSVITQHGQITGYGGPGGREERDEVIRVLDAGKLEATLYEEPVSEWTTDATLGADTVQRGMISMAASIVLVLAFMVVYYRFAGFVACFALLANLVLILAAMISIQAAFTLPGIAGLVLTVGMAVDSNVLIFERMREEINRGAAPRMAIRNGFNKAMSTIIDSNVTTLISAIVLYVIGTDQIRGFAVTLVLGIVMSMFTAIFCSRIIFDIWEKKFRPSTIKMMHMLTKTNIDFMAKRWLAATISIIVIAIGLGAVVLRGKGILDIDFLGGSSVQVVFKRGGGESARAEQGLALTPIAARSQQEQPEEEPGGAPAETPAGDDATQTAPSDDPAAENATPQDPTATEDPATDNPAKEDPAVEAVPGPAEPADEPPSEGPGPMPPPTPIGAGTADDPADSSGTTPAVDPDAGRKARYELTFVEKVAQTGLAKKIQALVDELASRHPLPEDAVAGEEDQIIYQIDARGFEPDSTAAFNVWYVTFTVPERFGDPQTVGQDILNDVKSQIESEPLFPSSFAIGGQVASEMRNDGIMALIACVFGIIIYLWVRFQRVAFGLAAVVALVHDVLVVLGFIALSKYLTFIPTIDPFKISLPILAAFLTIIGYSLNDTIVIFDRIREIKGKSPHLTRQMINDAVNQTLSRTILTFLTTFIVTIVLYFFGGHSIHGFAFAMVVGLIAGTYSTVFIASPVLLWLVEKGETAKPEAGATTRLAPASSGPAAARARVEP